MNIIAQVREDAVAAWLTHDWDDYNLQVQERLSGIAAKELAACSKGQAIVLQAPNNCDEINYIPGPPTLVIYKDRHTGRVRVFKFTFQWVLIELVAGGRAAP